MTKPNPTPEGVIVREVFGEKIRARWTQEHGKRILCVEGDVANDDDWGKLVEVYRRLNFTAHVVLAPLEELRALSNVEDPDDYFPHRI